jgi:hypothetical protein
MEKWRQVWREGFMPQLSTEGLEALETALACDDARLLQGTSYYPPLMGPLQGRAVEATCAICYCGWQGERLDTVSAVDQFFQRVCDGTDQQFVEPAACRFFLNWYDDTPREAMRRELLAEVKLALLQRRVAAA